MTTSNDDIIYLQRMASIIARKNTDDLEVVTFCLKVGTALRDLQYRDRNDEEEKGPQGDR